MKSLCSWFIIILLILATGCSLINDYWPATVPKDLLDYTKTDPNSIKWSCIASLRELREIAITQHIKCQMDYEFLLSKDKVLHDRALSQADYNIQQAIAEREAIIGSIDKPGWLLGILIGGTGLGAYIVGLRKQRPEDYNEDEFQLALKQGIDEAIKSFTNKNPA